jgi:hypothetical protein
MPRTAAVRERRGDAVARLLSDPVPEKAISARPAGASTRPDRRRLDD